MIKTRKAIEEFPQYQIPGESRKEYLRLDFSENTVGCSPKVIDALRTISTKDLSIYPEYSRINKKIADFLGVGLKNVLLTNGSDDAIRLLFEAYLEEGDEILLMEPSFDMFEFYAKLRNAKIKKVLLNDDLTFPDQRFIDAISEKTKTIVLCNPNNPTGTVIKRETIINVLEKSDGIVLVDEAYYDFLNESVINLTQEYENLAVARTFSKAYGLAGLRSGVIASSKEIISSLSKISSPFAVNSAAVIGLGAAIEDKDYTEEYVAEIEKSKKYVLNELKKTGIMTYPTAANFFVAEFGNDVDSVCDEFRKRGILIRNRNTKSLLKGCARISFGTLEQSITFISALKDILAADEKSVQIKTDAILFDMDGVLIDVSKSYRTAIKMTAEIFLKKFGIIRDFSDDDIQSIKEKSDTGNDWIASKELIKKSLNRKEIKKTLKNETNENILTGDPKKSNIVRIFQELYLGSRTFEERYNLRPEMDVSGLIDNENLAVTKETLKAANKKYPLAIVTSRPRYEARYALDYFRIKEFFQTVIAMEDMPLGKSQGIRIALKRLGKDNGVYLGDSVSDMATACAAGDMQAIGIIPPGTEDKEKLSTLLYDNGAVNVLDDINEILNIIDR
ncbi:MAG: histidinol-phosphate transaminase [Nanoarchaeota archaeon]|nr:histidinol-phosphate transaminase [Nanoarchaeota archaeon]